MPRSVATLLAVLLAHVASSQPTQPTNQQAIRQVLATFTKCLVHKDSTAFYSLFYPGPVTWVGVTRHKSYAAELARDSRATDSFSANYKAFYRHFYAKAVAEKFANVQIWEDGYVASVMFDYSFWENAQKVNWGKESWALLKTNGQWKIAAVVFSTEDEAVNAQAVGREHPANPSVPLRRRGQPTR